MSAPTLTPAEISQLQAQKAQQQNTQSTMTSAIAQNNTVAANYGVSDGAFKKFFDYYNTNIISEYDAERKALNGTYYANPISEADIVGPATLDGNIRTTPITPATDIVRVAEFDGGNTITTLVNETQSISDQAGIEAALSGGYPIHFNPLTCITTTTLTSISTTLGVSDPSNPVTILVGDIFIVSSFTDLAVVKITSINSTPVSPPPYAFTYGISFIVPPSGTLAIGDAMSAFSGFSNSERTTKTAGNALQQPLMNSLISNLQAAIAARQARLGEELTALAANQDPDGTTNIATATTNCNTANSFLTAYLVSTDISNSGLSSLSAERSARNSQISTRVGQITAAYTGQSKNYYNQRYTFANDRGNTVTGTLRLQKAALAVVAQLTAYAASAGNAIAAINSILS